MESQLLGVHFEWVDIAAVAKIVVMVDIAEIDIAVAHLVIQ